MQVVQPQPHRLKRVQADLEGDTVGMEATPAILPSTALLCPTPLVILVVWAGTIQLLLLFPQLFIQGIDDACMQNEQKEVVQSIALQS